MKSATEIDFRKIHLAEIEKLRQNLCDVLNIEVSYDPDALTMAKMSIARMKVLLEQIIDEIETQWIAPPSDEWPRVRDLPEAEREPFSKWLRGQTAPHLSEEVLQDGYYQWDYDQWKKRGV